MAHSLLVTTHCLLSDPKPYADLGGALLDAARRYADEVRGGEYPDAEHSYS